MPRPGERPSPNIVQYSTIAQLRRTLFFYLLFLNPCIMSLVVPNITHFDDIIQVTGSFTGIEQRLIQRLLQLPGDRHRQHSRDSNAYEREQSTPNGVSGPGFSLSLHFEKEGKKRPLLPLIFLLLQRSTPPYRETSFSTCEFLRLKRDFTCRPGTALVFP